MSKVKIKLGNEFEDSVTGFKGIAVSRTEYLTGCDRIEIQPRVDEKGEITDSVSFDVGTLKKIGEGIILTFEKEPPGGPRKINSKKSSPKRKI